MGLPFRLRIPLHFFIHMTNAINIRICRFELRPVFGFFESRLPLDIRKWLYIDPFTDDKEAGQIDKIDHTEYYL
jgi:hypothetical protein